MAGRFSAAVGKWAEKSTDRMTAVFRESAERMIEQAQTPVGEGGKMRVDTGFLRASGQASLSGLPTGPSQRGIEAPGSFDYTFVISQAQLGGTIWFGWTANYAIYREFHDGFMRSAAQNWQQIVSDVVREVSRG